MQFTLSQIRKIAVNKAFAFDKYVDVSELAEMNNDIREIESVRVQGNCVLDGDQLIFSLRIEGEMVLPCARTLVDVHYPFDINEVEVFSDSPYYGKEEVENEIYPVDGEVIDLIPCIQENILLAIPFRVFTNDKQVLEQALVKRDGWELSVEEDEEDQEKKEKPIDPRMKKLQSLLDNNKKEN